MSARLSSGLPSACSGLIYDAVPKMTPVAVAIAVIVGDADSPLAAPSLAIAFASPKSKTFTVPSPLTLIFAGFRSRWMTPCS